MIADTAFGAPSGGVRALRFVPRAEVSLAAACLVADGIRETLRELLGEHCELVLGEPVAVDAQAWALLARDAFLFLTRGRRTDIVLVVPQADARRLVRRAFGEGDAQPDGACSALEAHALERIAARCAAAFDPLCAERAGGSRAVRAPEAPACAAYFDVRVRAPVPLALGIGLVRDLPGPVPADGLPPGVLEEVALELRAVFAEGTIDMPSFLELRPGDIVRLDTRVGAPASLHADGRRLATGVAGVAAARAAFLVHDVAAGATP